MEQKLGRVPTTEELARGHGCASCNKVDWMLRVSWLPLSLESPINEDEEDSELGMFVEDKITPTPMQCAYSKLLREKVEEVLETLPPREARILRLRFGLENGRIYTLEEVGAEVWPDPRAHPPDRKQGPAPPAPPAPCPPTARIPLIPHGTG